jgi:hypothetical protein
MTERFITNITFKWALPCMNAHAPSKHQIACKISYIHHTEKAVPQYESADDLPNDQTS